MDTHPASHTQVIVDNGAYLFAVPSNGFFGTGRRTGGILAVLARQGQIPSVIVQVNHPDTGSFGVAHGYPYRK